MTDETKERIHQRLDEILKGQSQSLKTIDDIERIALTIGEELKQAALEEAGKEVQESETKQEQTSKSHATKLSCPHCQKNAWFKGLREKEIQTIAGILSLKRAYYYCKKCKEGFYPLDTVMGLEKQNTTLQFQQTVAKLCAKMSYEMAMQTLSDLTSLQFSKCSAQRLCTQKVSSLMQQYIAKQQETNLPLAYLPPTKLPADLPSYQVLYAQADGVHTPMRDGKWREMKVGVVQAKFRDGREQMPSRYTCTLKPCEEFAKQWEALALSCGSLKAQCLTILGDGAVWIWNLASTHFPRAVQILDFFHASEYVASVAHCVFGQCALPDGANKVQEKIDKLKQKAKLSWLSARLSEMKRSDWSSFWQAIEIVEKKVKFSGHADLKCFSELRTYFTNNASRMDYASYLSRGLCIGSGLAESSCKRIVSERLKGSGMRWSVEGAQVIAFLRGCLLGNEWAEFVAFWNRQSLRPSV
jgi:hypothetical protein